MTKMARKKDANERVTAAYWALAEERDELNTRLEQVETAIQALKPFVAALGSRILNKPNRGRVPMVPADFDEVHRDVAEQLESSDAERWREQHSNMGHHMVGQTREFEECSCGGTFWRACDSPPSADAVDPVGEKVTC